MPKITKPPTDLIVLEKCRTELASMHDMKSVLDVRDKARAIRYYMKAKGDARGSQNSAACIAALAEGRAGQLIVEGKKAGTISEGVPPGTEPVNKITQTASKRSQLGTVPLGNRQTLEDLGINKNTSSRLQMAATVLEESPTWFDEYRDECDDKDRDFTQTAIIRKSREISHSKLKKGDVEAPEGLFDVIVIDPPWPMKKLETDRDSRYASQVDLDYPTMSESELEQHPIPAAENCHVWVWTTQSFLPMALRLLPKWDLRYSCTFVWHKSKGMQTPGHPYYNCEFALYCCRGKPEFRTTKDFKTCYQWKSGKHSEKPEEFYDLIKRVTEGKRLDMFGRRKIRGFLSWGNEVNTQ